MLYLTPGGNSFQGLPDHLGCIVGPRARGIRPLREGRRWAADNDAFHGKFSEQGFLAHLRRLEPFRETCLFVALPDVVADPDATLLLYQAWEPRVHALGFPVAWVAQDGAKSVPPGCDAVFIGGTTEWKLSSDALHLCREAKSRDLWVHLGRVNSAKRSAMAAQMAADSVDGTKVAFVGYEACARLTHGWITRAKEAGKQQRLL